MMKQSNLSLVMMNLITLKIKQGESEDGEKIQNIMNLKPGRIISIILITFCIFPKNAISVFWEYNSIINSQDTNNIKLTENEISIKTEAHARYKIVIKLCISNKSPNTNYFMVYKSTIASRNNKGTFNYPKTAEINYWNSLGEKIKIYVIFNDPAGFGDKFFSSARYIDKSYRKSWREKPFKANRIKQTEKSLNNVRNESIRILPNKKIFVIFRYYLLNIKRPFLIFPPLPENNEFIFKSGNIYNKNGLNHPFIGEFIYNDETK